MKKRILIVFTISLTIFVGVNAEPADYETPTQWMMDRHEMQRQSVERLYKKWYSGPLHRMLTGRRRASKLAGKWANSKRSKSYIRKFVRKYDVDTDELARPLDEYETFNEFFIRTLKPGARPLPTDPTALISPADGNILVMQNINGNRLFPTKNVMLSIRKMLGDEALAQLFEGGTAIIVRLAPWDYHRYHFPLSGIAGLPRIIAGRFESVSPAVYLAGVQPLEVNERQVIRFQPDKSPMMAMVLVGALFVGAIVETYIPGVHYQQGDEMGYFEYGGSTMVMLFQKDTIRVAPEILAASAEGKETPVKMGQIIGHVIEKFGERIAE